MIIILVVAIRQVHFVWYTIILWHFHSFATVLVGFQFDSFQVTFSCDVLKFIEFEEIYCFITFIKIFPWWGVSVVRKLREHTSGELGAGENHCAWFKEVQKVLRMFSLFHNSHSCFLPLSNYLIDLSLAFLLTLLTPNLLKTSVFTYRFSNSSVLPYNKLLFFLFRPKLSPIFSNFYFTIVTHHT